ncbi:MAG: hypothetical protein SNJ64_00270 [Endomicrobiia bacterium]
MNTGRTKTFLVKATFLVGILVVNVLPVCATTGQAWDSWVQLSTAPGQSQGDGVCVLYVQREGEDKIYSMRGGSNIFQIYDITTDVWVTTTSLPFPARTGAAMTWDGGNFIYMLLSGTTFYRYNISSSSFTRLADPPGSVAGGGAIVYVSTQTGLNWCYAFQGGTNIFWRYNVNTTIWETVTAPGNNTGSGSSLVWLGGEYIYAVIGGVTTNRLRRYNVNTNSWSNMANAPNSFGAGGSLVWNGIDISSSIYSLRGGGNTEFWKYDVYLNAWSTMTAIPVSVGMNAGNRLSRYGNHIYGRLGTTGATDSFYRYRWRDVDVPGKITGFVAETGTLGGQINLSWICPGNDNYTGALPAGSTFYVQYASWTGVNFSTTTQPPQGGYHLFIPTGPVTQGQRVYYTVGGLEEYVTYYFRIWARDNAGNWSTISDGSTAWAMYTTDFIPPDAVSDLEALPIITQDNKITLKWTSPGDDFDTENLTGAYLIQYASHTTIETVVWQYSSAQIIVSTTNVTQGTTQYYTATLPGGTTYYFRMWARDEAYNYSTISNGATIYLGIYPPSAVTDLVATVWNSTVGAVALQWTAPSDPPSGGAVSSYIIRYATWNFSDSNFNNVNRARVFFIPKQPGQTEFVVITGLPSNQTVYFRIKSSDSVNNLSPIDTTESVANASVPPHLVISQFAAGTVSPTEEFVELYNPCPYDINLQLLGLKFRQRFAGGADADKSITFASTTIKAYGYFLIGTSTNATSGKRLDGTLSASGISYDGSVYITLASVADLSQAIDLIGYGAVTDPQITNYEQSIAPALAMGNSLIRKVSGGDTNLHNIDFELRTGTWTPKNSDDPTEQGGTVLSVSVSTGSFDFGLLPISSNVVAVSSITVINTGNVTERFLLSVGSSTPSNWVPVSGTPGQNQFRILCIFNSVRPAVNDFNTSYDYLYPANVNRASSETVFSGNQQGDNVGVGEERGLWLRLDTPSVNFDNAQQSVIITITAEQQ